MGVLQSAQVDDGINVGPLTCLRRTLTPVGEESAHTVVPITSLKKGSLKGIDVFVIPGGTPSVVKAALGGRNAESRLRAFVERGGGLVGICAGASALADVNLLKGVNTVEDGLWGDCGWDQKVNVTVCPTRAWGRPDHHKIRDDLTIPAYYNCGPVFDVDPGYQKSGEVEVLARFVTDVALDKQLDLNTVVQAQDVDRGKWVCKCCFRVNKPTSARCEAPYAFCGKAARDKQYPAVGSMPGKVAIVALEPIRHHLTDPSTTSSVEKRSGRIVAFSVHLENGRHDTLFRDVVVWAGHHGDSG